MKYLIQIIIGCCIGMLIGLSISETVKIILTGIISIIVSLASILSGIDYQLKENEKHNKLINLASLSSKINSLIILFLIVGLVIGSAIGIYIRTHNLLGETIDDQVRNWRSTGLTKQELSLRMFNIEYPKKIEKGGSSADKLLTQSVLFEISNEQCELLCNYSGDALITQINKMNDKSLDSLLLITKNPELLKFIIKRMCKCE